MHVLIPHMLTTHCSVDNDKLVPSWKQRYSVLEYNIIIWISSDKEFKFNKHITCQLIMQACITQYDKPWPSPEYINKLAHTPVHVTSNTLSISYDLYVIYKSGIDIHYSGELELLNNICPKVYALILSGAHKLHWYAQWLYMLSAIGSYSTR